MEFRILGPLEVAGEPFSGGPKPRALLVSLLLARGSPVSNDRLIDAVWGERPPASAAHALQVYVSELRKGGLEIERHGAGYRLTPDSLDAADVRTAAGIRKGATRVGTSRAGARVARRGTWALARPGARGARRRRCRRCRARETRGPPRRRGRGSRRIGAGARTRRSTWGSSSTSCPSTHCGNGSAASSCWGSTAPAGRPMRSTATARSGRHSTSSGSSRPPSCVLSRARSCVTTRRSTSNRSRCGSVVISPRRQRHSSAAGPRSTRSRPCCAATPGS